MKTLLTAGSLIGVATLLLTGSPVFSQTPGTTSLPGDLFTPKSPTSGKTQPKVNTKGVQTPQTPVKTPRTTAFPGEIFTPSGTTTTPAR